jgi:hypothetical protein
MDLSDRNALDVPLDEAVLQSLAAGNPEVIRPFASLRFDYNADFSSDTHPISHFSMLSADCRIPVRAPLGLHKFLYFIFHNFYANDRDKWSTVIEPLHFDLQDSILDAETKQMHIGWR